MPWNDGGLRYGSRKVKFYPAGAVDGNGSTTWTGTTKGIYILEVNTPTRPQFVQKQYSEARVPNGAFGVDDFVEMSATVQFGPSQYMIVTGDAFSTVLDATIQTGNTSGTAEGFVVIGTDEPETQGDVRKQNIRLQKLVSATIPAAYP